MLRALGGCLEGKCGCLQHRLAQCGGQDISTAGLSRATNPSTALWGSPYTPTPERGMLPETLSKHWPKVR